MVLHLQVGCSEDLGEYGPHSLLLRSPPIFQIQFVENFFRFPHLHQRAQIVFHGLLLCHRQAPRGSRPDNPPNRTPFRGRRLHPQDVHSLLCRPWGVVGLFRQVPVKATLKGERTADPQQSHGAGRFRKHRMTMRIDIVHARSLFLEEQRAHVGSAAVVGMVVVRRLW